jgi:hypothetical protein
VVERCFNRLKRFRDLATRYAKRVAYYRSDIVIAAIVLWLRADLQDMPLILTLGSMWCMTRSTSWELIGPPRSSCGRARCQLRMRAQPTAVTTARVDEATP